VNFLRPNQPSGPEHYLSGQYDSLIQWVSYWQQIEEVFRALPAKRGQVLEIGPGNGTVTAYLRKEGYDVETLDADPALQPTYVQDAARLRPAKKYDVLLCCEVLEHLPFTDFHRSIAGLRRAVKEEGKVILSLPYSCLYFSLNIGWFYTRLFWPAYRFLGWEPSQPRAINLTLPFFFLRRSSTPWHFWEAGQRGTSRALIRLIVGRYFIIEREKHNPLYPYHWFLILRPKRLLQWRQ
jgi:SAM-dependent methyltransferase